MQAQASRIRSWVGWLIVLAMVSIPVCAMAADEADATDAQPNGDAAPPAEQAAKPAAPAAEPGDAASMGEVVVTGTRVETDNMEVPADVRVIDETRLKRPGTKSTMQALGDVSGVKTNPRQEAATFTDLEVRGLTSNTTSGGNVLILLDGIPQRRLSFGGPYQGALPYDAITRLELVKGPMSSLYGRNALVGALQLFSDPGSPVQRFHLTLGFEYPSNTFHAGVRAAGPLGQAPIGSATEVSTYSLTGSFTYAEGWQPNNNMVKGDVYLHVKLRLSDDDTLTILGGFFSADEEYLAPVFVDADGRRLMGIDRSANLAVPGQNSLDLNEYRLALKYKRQWMKAFSSNLALSYWHGDTFWKVGRPSDAPAEGTIASRPASDRGFYENGVFTELEFLGEYDADWLKGSLSVGASYEYLTYIMTMVSITTQDAFAAGGAYGAGIPVNYMTGEGAPRSQWVYSDQTQRDTFEHNVGLFARKQFNFIDRIFLHAGLRFDHFERTQENPDNGQSFGQNGWAISPGVGLNFAIVKRDDYKFNLYGNWGRGFSPVFRAVGDTAFADVEPETSESFDVGMKTQMWNRILTGSLVFYQLERKDVVAYDSSIEQWMNAGTWRVRGIETDWRVRPIDEVEVYVAYTWRDPIITRSDASPDLEGNRIPTVSDHTFTGGLNWEVAMGMGGGTEFRYVSDFYGNEANSFNLPSYLLWDLWLYYNYNDLFRVSAYAKNLLDTEYYTAVFGGVKNGSAFEGLPRSFGIGFDASF